MPEKYKAPSVKKAFEILKLISASDYGLGVSDLAKGSGISKGTVHGITSALEDLGTIIRDPSTKKYKLGLTLLELGRSAYSQIDLEDVAKPIMEDLMDRVHESVFVGVLNGDRVTILDIVESRQDLKITSPKGRRETKARRSPSGDQAGESSGASQVTLSASPPLAGGNSTSMT